MLCIFVTVYSNDKWVAGHIIFEKYGYSDIDDDKHQLHVILSREG